jgi:hypothetical protein
MLIHCAQELKPPGIETGLAKQDELGLVLGGAAIIVICYAGSGCAHGGPLPVRSPALAYDCNR